MDSGLSEVFVRLLRTVNLSIIGSDGDMTEHEYKVEGETMGRRQQSFGLKRERLPDSKHNRLHSV
jgi:hypothetical protein